MSKEITPFPPGRQSARDWCSIDEVRDCPYKNRSINCGIKKRLLQVPLKRGARRREAERLWELAQTNPDAFYSLCVDELYGY